MEDHEIITNEEVLEVPVEFVESGSGNGLKIFGGVVALAGLAYGGYKLYQKKKKAKKEQKNDKDGSYDLYEDEYRDVEVE